MASSVARAGTASGLCLRQVEGLSTQARQVSTALLAGVVEPSAMQVMVARCDRLGRSWLQAGPETGPLGCFSFWHF